MQYEVVFRPRSLKDLDGLSPDVAARIVGKIHDMSDDLKGDVKRLTNHEPQYRLRVSDWRVLFEIDGQRVVIYRVLHRSKAYE